jgi:DNA-binding winged helix-turn-helix (wHTH) protein
MQEFSTFRLDTVNQCLWRRGNGQNDERILLTPKAFAVLRYLVEHPGRLVTQDELLGAVWPDTYVQPEVLKYQIADIRGILGDRAKQPLFIETLPRRGYRFIAAVREARSQGSSTFVRSSPGALVGRDGPLSELRDDLRSMLLGNQQIVFITGEPGIGKTALADEFQREALEQAPDLLVARGQCIEGYGGREAYYPMLQALGRLCRSSAGAFVLRTLADMAPVWAIQLPALLPVQDRERLRREISGATRERMLREICEALEVLTEKFPLLLVFEDLQWADVSTVDLISALARSRTPARVMLVATTRPVDSEAREQPLRLLKQELISHRLCRDIRLGPLCETDVAAYLAAGSQLETLPDGFAEALHRRSEGNPLFMVAVLEHLNQQGLVRKENGIWTLALAPGALELGVPENLRQLIEARIQTLSRQEQSALEAASVTGASFSSNISASAAAKSPERFETICESLARRRRFIAAAGLHRLRDGSLSQSYEFLHAVYREVLYDRQTPGRRAKLHRLNAERLETVFQPNLNKVAAQLAYHFEQAGDWSKAIQYEQSVAQRAYLRHAPEEAAARLRHALDLCARLHDSARAVSETQILEKLASIYVVSFDMRCLQAYRTLRKRAVHYALVETEARALVDIAYPVSWTSSKRCRIVVDRALRLASSSPDPIFSARTRASCLVRRIWAQGWNEKDAEDCRNAIEEIRQKCDPITLAWHRVDCSFLLWCSSEYREAHRCASESLSVLLKGEDQSPYASLMYWLSQFTVPWSLLFLGQWGGALREIDDGVRMAHRNGEHYRAQTLLLYRAWVGLEAMDFAGVLSACDSLLPSITGPARTPWRRLCAILAASAETATGNLERALDLFLTVQAEMDRQTVIHDWYWRMLLQSGLSELWLAKGDLAQARVQGRTFLNAAMATAERTWQARAWETNARIAMAERDLPQAQLCVARALSTMEGFETPLAAWRVHATAANLAECLAKKKLASYHREASCSIVSELADSLKPDQRMRNTFLSAPAVRELLNRQTQPQIAISHGA